MNRRRFVQAVAGVAAMAPKLPVSAQDTVPPVKMVRTGVLEIGYHETGDPSGVPVILLHGFPDDAHAYDRVSPALAAAGHRALAVYLRGFGPTRFLDASAPRMAEQAAIGQDVLDFADALGLSRFVVAGFDWGGRAACVVSALHPERVRALVPMSGYSIQDTVTPPTTAGSPEGARRAWYQWYFNTEQGRLGLTQNRRGLCELMWREWSPTWQFSRELYEQTAASFDNPDFVDCVIHSYRHRNFNAPGEPRFAEIEKRLAARPPVEVPTFLVYGGDDAFGRPPAEMTAAERRSFPRLIGKRVIEGSGHFTPHETPAPVAAAILEAIAATR